MNTVPEDKLSKWIAARFADITSEGSISRLELFHAVDGEHGEKMATLAVEEGADPGEATQVIWDAAEHDATTRYSGAPNRYVLQAYRADQLEPDSSYPFVLRGRASPNYMLGNDTDAPTDRGERGQMLRHNQQMHTLMMQVAEGSVGRVMRDNELLRERCDRLEKLSFDMFDKYQELSDRGHERNLEQARQESKERRHDQMMGMIMGVLPAVLSGVLGARGLPATMTGAVRDQGIMQLLKGLDENQMGSILNVLRPEQQMALFELYKSYREEHLKDEQGKHPMLREEKPATEPIGDVASVKH